MHRKGLTFLLLCNLIFFTLLIGTVTIYYLSIREGNGGVVFDLFGGKDDGLFYWEQTQNILEGSPWVRTSIYPLITAALIRLTTINDPIIIRLFNLFCYAYLIYFAMKTTKLLLKSEIKTVIVNIYSPVKRLLLLMIFFYLSILMNLLISINRDILIYTIYMWSIYLTIRILKQQKNLVIDFIPLILVLWLLGELRAYALLSFIVATFIFQFFKVSLRGRYIALFTSIIIIAGAVYYTFFIDFTVPIINLSLREGLNYRLLNLANFSGGSQMWISLDQPNIFSFFLNYFHSYLGNLFGPLPWHILSFSTLLVFFVETIPMLFILFYLFKTRKHLSNGQKFLLVHAFVWVSFIALSNDNVGTATRLRVIAWMLIVVVFSIQIFKIRYFKKENIADFHFLE